MLLQAKMQNILNLNTTLTQDVHIENLHDSAAFFPLLFFSPLFFFFKCNNH